MGGLPRHVAVIVVEVDQVADICALQGAAAADLLVTEIEQSLRAVALAGDQVVHIRDGRFTVVTAGSAGPDGALSYAGRLRQALVATPGANGRAVCAMPSIGIAMGGPGRPFRQLLAEAEVAVRWARTGKPDQVAVYDDRLARDTADRIAVEAGLSQALAGGQIQAYHQAVVSLASGQVVGTEALARWEDPLRGTVAPGRFVPVAEQTGLVVPLGRRIMALACDATARWRAEVPGAGDLAVSVNVSGSQLGPRFVDDVEWVLSSSSLPPSALALELTEATCVTDRPEALAQLVAAKELGCHLALDDFGKGYSSVALLHAAPFDVVKLDKCFVDDLPCRGHKLVRSLVALAHGCGAAVVAEGVERAEQAASLRDLGCQMAQGYLYSAPLPPGAVPAMLDRFTSAVPRATAG